MAAMRALILAHDHVSPAGPIGDQLERRRYRLEHFLVVPEEQFATPDVTTTLPDFTSYDAVVVLGAPWSVYDEETIGRNAALPFAKAATACAFFQPIAAGSTTLSSVSQPKYVW